MRYALAMTVAVILAVATAAAGGEGSSLLRSGRTVPAPVVNARGEEVQTTTTEMTVENTSLIAVQKPKARKFKLHDIITIVVREESQSSSETEAQAEKTAELSADIKEWIKLTKGRLSADDRTAAENPKIDVGLGRNYEGNGEATTKDSFLTKIAAEVIDVKPNGNLVLEARRYIQSNDEKLRMTLTGMVAPTDVSATNTVNSTSVADLTVTKQTEGIARDGQKRGWLIRLLELINPF